MSRPIEEIERDILQCEGRLEYATYPDEQRLLARISELDKELDQAKKEAANAVETAK